MDGILFKATAETLISIAADPKHLGARIGLTAIPEWVACGPYQTGRFGFVVGESGSSR